MLATPELEATGHDAHHARTVPIASALGGLAIVACAECGVPLDVVAVAELAAEEPGQEQAPASSTSGSP